MHVQKMSKLKYILIITGIIGLWSFGYFGLRSDINDLQKGVIVINGDELLGGITRTKIGIQTAWVTNLIPSLSFTVDLGSGALPVNDIFTASVSFNGELMPDGALCSNDQILKKTGAATGIARLTPLAAEVVAELFLTYDLVSPEHLQMLDQSRLMMLTLTYL